MNTKKLKFLERILNKYNYNGVYFCYNNEKVEPENNEVVISVLDDHYSVYTNSLDNKFNAYDFKKEEMVLCYVACLFDNEDLYNEIMSFLNDKENQTLMTDFYELTMAQTYFNEGKKDEKVFFDIFFRKNPFEGGYTMSGGLDETIKYIENLRFSDSDINYLRKLGKFNDEFLNYLADLEFSGDVYGVPDGTAIFPNEPVLTVETDIITAQLLETTLLANFNHGSLVTTAAKRVTSEANNNGKQIPVMEFGARRARGVNSAIEASKNAFIGGCCGTSNTKAGKLYGIPVLGTMAHSLVTESENEYEAFLGYAKSNPDNCIFLVDTYDTLKSGIPNAIRVANEYLKPNGFSFKGIRIDSGDLAYLSKEARKMLDEAGYPDATICLSNGLNEYSISDLLKQGAVIDSIGAGDNIAAPNERVGGVYKLVAVEKDGVIEDRIKVSEDSIKTINPARKRVYRFYDKDTGYALGDVITLAEEKIADNQYTLVHPVETWKKTTLKNYNVRPLLEPIFKDGKLVYKDPSIKEKQTYCHQEYESLYPEVTRISKPSEYYVDLSNKLRELKNELIKLHQEEVEEKSYQKIKK